MAKKQVSKKQVAKKPVIPVAIDPEPDTAEEVIPEEVAIPVKEDEIKVEENEDPAPTSPELSLPQPESIELTEQADNIPAIENVPAETKNRKHPRGK
jgi:hypothetical protein